MSSTQEKIEVMQAFMDGEHIECSPRGKEDWRPVNAHPLWNWGTCDYRVKEVKKKFVQYSQQVTVEEGSHEHDVFQQHPEIWTRIGEL